MAVVGIQRLSQVLNISPRRINQLAKEGLPREGRGKYDLGKSMMWYIRYLQGCLEKKQGALGDGEYAGLKDERIRGLRADAELKEMQLAEKRGYLISLADAKHVLMDLVHMTKARMLAIPARVAAELTGETSRVMVQAKLEKTIKDSLSHLADDGSHFTPKRME
jgi:phage terminase Nu1 subunit (DNA packaging protein)